MAVMTLSRTSGDEREDTASAAGATARDALEHAELMILAGMAAELRKVVSGSLTAATAQRHVRALIAASLGAAMTQIRALLAGLPQTRSPGSAPPSCKPSSPRSPRSGTQPRGDERHLSALFAEAVRSYFGGESALPLPSGNTAALRASQLAAAQEVMDSLASNGIAGFTDSAGKGLGRGCLRAGVPAAGDLTGAS